MFKFKRSTPPAELNRICNLCKYAQNAVWKCLNCSDTMCEGCAKIHRNSKVSRGHVIITQKEKAEEETILKRIRCDTHKSENNDMFCLTCDKPICKVCITEDHRSHQLIQFETKAEQEKQKLRRTLQDESQLTLKHLKELIEQQEKYENEFREKNEKVLENIDGRVVEIVDAIRSIRDKMRQENETKIEEMTRNGESLKKISNSVKHASTEAEEAIRSENDLDLIRKSKLYKSRLNPKIPELVRPVVHDITRNKLDKDIFAAVKKECNSRGSDKEFSHLIEKNAQLLKEIDKIKQEQEREVKAHQDRCNNLSERKANLEREINILRTQNSRLEQDKELYKSQRDSISESMRDLERDLVSLQIQIETDKKKYNTNSTVLRCKDLEKEVNQLRKDKERIQQEAESTISKLKKETAVLKRRLRRDEGNQMSGKEVQNPNEIGVKQQYPDICTSQQDMKTPNERRTLNCTTQKNQGTSRLGLNAKT